MQFGRNVGYIRYTEMGDYAPGRMNDRIKWRDIPRVYQPYSVYLRDRKRKTPPEQLGRFDDTLQPK